MMWVTFQKDIILYHFSLLFELSYFMADFWIENDSIISKIRPAEPYFFFELFIL